MTIKSAIVKTSLLSLFFAFSFSCVKGQFDSAAFISNIRQLNSEHSSTLVDKKTGTKYVLDSSRCIINAIGIHGNLLWRTNPNLDNKLFDKRYYPHPFIKEFILSKDKSASNREEIYIVYNYNLYGFLNKRTGKWILLGKD